MYVLMDDKLVRTSLNIDVCDLDLYETRTNLLLQLNPATLYLPSSHLWSANRLAQSNRNLPTPCRKSSKCRRLGALHLRHLSSSIMPGFCGRDNGHKALCPLSG
eukprot:COSAG02_NODE_6308_length_3665_cov_3.449243_5_plen_103_part_01